MKRTALARGKGPERRTPLRGGGVRSSAAVKAADDSGPGLVCWNPPPPGPLRRTRLRTASAKTVAARPEKDRVRAEVFLRDRRCRLVGRDHGQCLGPPTFHHLRKASDNGAYTTANGVCLCAYHNTYVEQYPAWAKGVGLAERGQQTPKETWAKLHAAHLAASPEVGSAP